MNVTALGQASSLPRAGVECTSCFVSVEARSLSGQARFGVRVRQTGDRSAYDLSFDDALGVFRFTFVDSEASGDKTLIPETPSAAIKKGEVNKLAVLANGDHFHAVD
jgi:hypothetical protein